MLLKLDLVVFCWLLVLLMLANTNATKIENALQYRQNVPVGTGGSASATPSSSPSAVSSVTLPVSSTQSSANAPGPASSNTVIAETTSRQSNENPSSSATVISQTTSEPNQASISSVQGSTSVNVRSTTASPQDHRSTDASSATQVQSRSVISRTQEFVTTVVTISSGSTRTNVFTTSGLVPVSTSTSASTSKPSLDTSQSGSSKSGLDSSQKRIIIGVVVGIGGAILLGGIVVVVWRIWGRKERSHDDDNDLMGSHPGSSGHEKRSSISGQSPFRSTLDQYHNNGGPPNTASNF
ncbi:MAG: hypothetical protein L6R41_000520 [Letrouitia leprolyta]|nr:MAG: hypothetical protein L6R41_000520 [Letrouitia leprolyta]